MPTIAGRDENETFYDCPAVDQLTKVTACTMFKRTKYVFKLLQQNYCCNRITATQKRLSQCFVQKLIRSIMLCCS